MALMGPGKLQNPQRGYNDAWRGERTEYLWPWLAMSAGSAAITRKRIGATIRID